MDQQPQWPVPARRFAGQGASFNPAFVDSRAGAQNGDSAAPSVGKNMAGVLEAHLVVCNQLLALAQKESDALKSSATFPAAETRAERKALLNRLNFALNDIVHERSLWQQPSTESVTRDPRVARLVSACLDTIMRILVLDRENEEQLLRRGLLPARALPAAEQARPHFVAGLYQRHGQPRA